MFNQNLKICVFFLPLAFLCAFGSWNAALGQRARFSDPFQVAPQSPAGGVVVGQPVGAALPGATAPVFPQAGVGVGGGAAVQVPPGGFPAPGVQSGAQFGAGVNPFPGQVLPQGAVPAPVFDPFQNSTPLPNFGGAPPPVQVLPPNGAAPPAGYGPGYPYGANPYGNSPYGVYNPAVSGNSRWPSTGWAWPSQVWARLRNDIFPRLMERPRFRHTWLAGESGNELDINDVELATTLTFPVGQTGQFVRVTPGFAFHFWSGPDTGVTGVDLPGQAYSAFLALDHATDPARRLGLETNLTVGVYSDFQHLDSDSLRLTGVGLGWLKLNEINTLKIGVEYFDRIKTKILPAFGVFISPTPDFRMDVYFPRPRLAQRLSNLGDYEVWAYVGAEYGGGSWTIERDGGMDDQVDINDVRSFVGLEWMGPRRVTGFFEVGYVVERELVFKSMHPFGEINLQDTIMLRGGFAF